MSPIRIALVALGLGILMGLGLGYRLYHGSARLTPRADQPSPEIKLPNNAIIIKTEPSRAPLASLPGLPKGSTVVRQIDLDVKPDPSPKDERYSEEPPQDPDKHSDLVHITVDLVRGPDGHLRAVAMAKGGSILAAVDVPTETAPIVMGPPPPKTLKWAAGGVYGATAWGDRSVGAFVDRDMGFLRTGVELTRETYATGARMGWEVRVKVGIRF